MNYQITNEDIDILCSQTLITKETAKKISKGSVENGLAACCNFWPVETVYKWENKLKENIPNDIIIVGKIYVIYMLFSSLFFSGFKII